MGMKPRKKAPMNSNNVIIEHDHESVRKLCLAMPRIAADPVDCAQALVWALALIMERLVPEGELDEALNAIRDELTIKACMLRAFPAEKAIPLWDWVAEGADSMNPKVN